MTKNKDVPKEQRMGDSLQRIRQQPKEIWAVKFADRISTLQTSPEHWSNAKKTACQQEASVILNALHGGNTYLENRLSKKIETYRCCIR